MSFLFESLVNLTVGKLIKTSAISNDDFELYHFSVEVAYLKAIHFISYFAISLVMHKVIEGIIILTIFCAFRRNVGGYHARTRMGCYFFSCFTIFGSLYLTEINFSADIQIFIVICTLMVLIMMPPVYNYNRPVSIDDDRYFRRRLRISGGIFTLLFVILGVLSLWKFTWICTMGLFLATSLAILGKVQNARDGKILKN